MGVRRSDVQAQERLARLVEHAIAALRIFVVSEQSVQFLFVNISAR
jgi:hypothetical protein